MKPLNVSEAYDLGEDGDHREYYDRHAESYDRDLVGGEGYIYAEAVGRTYTEYARAGDSPVADLGCGTGLVGEYFTGTEIEIDGFDLSAGMLEVAGRKGVYRHLYEVDLTTGLATHRGAYGALTSCGTFTIGHLGPPALEQSLDLAHHGALCVIGINSVHFHDAGFENLFDTLVGKGRITEPDYQRIPIYRDAGEDPVNWARMVIFRIG